MRPILIAGAGVLVASAAHAEFEYVTTELYDAGAPPGLFTHRVYAVFSDPTDQLLGVGALEGVRELRFVTTVPNGLVNDAESILACTSVEDFAQAPVGTEWDSYVTVGASTFHQNDTDITPGFAGSDGVHPVILGNSICDPRGGWVDNGPQTPVHPDPDGRVLIAQFTLASEEPEFWMEGMILWRPKETDGFLFTPFELLYDAVPFPEMACFEEAGCCLNHCDADADNDCNVGFADVLTVLEQWGPCPQPFDPCNGDVDADDSVGLADLLTVLGSWGPCEDLP